MDIIKEKKTMTDAMFDLLYIMETVIRIVFYIGVLILAYRYIEVRKIKQ